MWLFAACCNIILVDTGEFPLVHVRKESMMDPEIARIRQLT
jgi:hypothetical protein